MRSQVMGPATARDAPRLVDTLQLRGGQSVMVRAAEPRDGDSIQSYIRGLSSDSRRNRFFRALNELSPAELHRMTHPQHRRQLALIAETITEGVCTMIGEARYAVAGDDVTCEIAVSVAEAWRRRTLGTQLFEILARRAKGLGVHYLVADVLRSNEAMTALARQAGFVAKGPIADPRSIRMTKTLARPDVVRSGDGRTAQDYLIAV